MAKLRLGGLALGLSGTLGNTVAASMPDGTTVVRERPQGQDPDTDAQRRVRELMRRAARAFRGLTAAEQRAWQAYVEEERRRFAREGLGLPPRAYNLFTGLAYQVLRIDPEAVVPKLPPPGPFVGDSVALSVEPLPGAVRYRADAPNGLDVVTEIVMSRVRTAVSDPGPRGYRSQGFVRFEPGALVVDVPLPGYPWNPPWVACGARYLRPSTGQSAPLLTFGVLPALLDEGAEEAA